MKRNDWEFEKSAAELGEAAATRCEYHLKRLSFWQGEREAAEAAIRESGLEVREHQQTGGPRHEVILDPMLSRRLGECDAKIQGHEARVEEYAQWRSHLNSAGNRSFTLDHADWIFFFDLHGDEDE